MSEVLATYTIELLGPRPSGQDGIVSVGAVGLRAEYLRELQENISSLLPESYSVRIRPLASKNLGSGTPCA